MIVRGKYIILESVGAGGMASVYRARHRLLNEMRAIKVVLARFAADEDFLRRFRHEAAIARRLRHENAVWVEDLDEIEDGRPFIAMEFLQGGDLRKLIKDQGSLSVDRTLRLGAQVASALSAAHKLGIVHRDIKPDNIFITHDSSGNEVAKVLDFGIAKAREGVLQGAITATKTGIIIGTPEYMSPEQAEGQMGEKLDGRADIYSLGVVLYEMLTGQLPFKSDTPLGMCLHHLQTVPRPPHEVRPDLRISPAVSALLMKALEKKRERRFQSADEMLAALRNPNAGNDTGAFAPTRVSPRQTVPVASAQTTGAMGASSTGAAARVQAAATPPKSSVAEPPKSAIKAASVPQDKGRRLRIILAALAVILCASGGYLLLKVNERRNAALREHDTALRDLVVEKLQTSPALHSRGKDITVTVSGDAVTLGGNVSLAADKDAAASEARSVSGVSDVVNNIAVVSLPPPTPAQLSNPPPVASTDAQPQVSETRPPPKTQRKTSARPDNGNSAIASDLVKRGNDEIDQGLYAPAIRDFQQALRFDPGSADARTGLDRARNAQKTEDEVLKRRQQP